MKSAVAHSVVRGAVASLIGYNYVIIATAQDPSTWINSAGGEITSPANWNGPVVSATQNGIFNLNNTYTVTVANDTTVLGLGVTAGDVSISVAAARTLLFNGVYQVDAGATGTVLGAGAVNSLRFTNHGNMFLDTAVTLAAGTSTSDGILAVGRGASGSVAVGDGVILSATNGFRLADTAGVSGTINQTGGTVRADAGITFGLGVANYNFGGASLEVGSVNGLHRVAGGTGAFNFSGGTIRVIGSDLTSNVDATLLPTLSATNVPTIDTNGLNATWSGTLTAPGLHQAGVGGNALIKAGLGTLTFSGATRVLDTFAVTGGATQQIAGATSAVELAVGTGTGSTGSYVMDGGTLLIKESTLADNTTPVAGSFRVGDFSGTGAFTQNGGTITVGGSQSPLAGAALNIGNQGGTGTYNLNGGTLTLAGGLNVLGRSAGTNPISTGVLNIGQTGASTLLEITNGSSLINGNNAAVTNLGTGTINQNGGTVRASDGTIYVAGFGNGTYNLNGGVLEIAGTGLQARYNNTASTSTFNFGDGMIRVIESDMVSDVNANLVEPAGSVIDTNGLNASLTGSLAGVGQLVKTGDGFLTLSGINSHSGGTSVLDGELIANGSAVLGSGNVAFADSTSLSLGGTNTISLNLGNNASLSLTGTTVRVNLASTTQFDSVVGSGLLSSASFANSVLDFTGSTIFTGSFPIFASFGSFSGDLAITGYDTANFTASYSDGIVTFAVVPEPRSIGVIALGFLGLALIHRRRPHRDFATRNAS